MRIENIPIFDQKLILMKYSFIFFSCIICGLLTSCFEIREEVNLKADGSGELTIVANLSQSKGKVRQYLKLGTAEGHYVPKPYEVNTLLSQVKSILEETEGITFTQTKSDWSNFIFSVVTRFDNVEALNEGMRKLSKHLKQYGVPELEVDNFSFSDGQFQRHFDYPSQPEEFRKLPPVQQRMFESAKMISIYRFEKPIQNHSHTSAKLSPSGRAIMLQLPLADLATGNGTLMNIIEFGD